MFKYKRVRLCFGLLVLMEYASVGYSAGLEQSDSVLLPFEEYVKEFVGLQNCLQMVTKKVEVTETGIKEIYRTENKMYIKNIGYT